MRPLRRLLANWVIVSGAHVAVTRLKDQYLRILFTEFVEAGIELRKAGKVEAAVLIRLRFHDLKLSTFATARVETEADQLPIGSRDCSFDRLARIGIDDPSLDWIRRVVRRTARV